jgi:hypothetical protein
MDRPMLENEPLLVLKFFRNYEKLLKPEADLIQA